MHPVRIVKTYLPIVDATIFAHPITDVDVFQACPSLRRVIDLIQCSSPIGKIGNYDGVYEFNLGFEGFTPRYGAKPRIGSLNSAIVTPCIELQTYAELSVPPDLLHNFLLNLERIHPWEVPIIQISSEGCIYLFNSRETL